MIKGTREQLDEIKAAIKALGEGGPGANMIGGNIRVISLEKAIAPTVAEALEKLMKQMRPNQVDVIVPTGEPRLQPQFQPQPQPQSPLQGQPARPGSGEEHVKTTTAPKGAMSKRPALDQ